ncbi:MAG: hypothetical protein BKPUNTRY_001667 [Candidatus Fervidibacter sp.]
MVLSPPQLRTLAFRLFALVAVGSLGLYAPVPSDAAASLCGLSGSGDFGTTVCQLRFA